MMKHPTWASRGGIHAMTFLRSNFLSFPGHMMNFNSDLIRSIMGLRHRRRTPNISRLVMKWNLINPISTDLNHALTGVRDHSS